MILGSEYFYIYLLFHFYSRSVFHCLVILGSIWTTRPWCHTVTELALRMWWGVQHTINGRPLKSAFRVQVDSHQLSHSSKYQIRKEENQNHHSKRKSFQIYIFLYLKDSNKKRSLVPSQHHQPFNPRSIWNQNIDNPTSYVVLWTVLSLV